MRNNRLALVFVLFFMINIINGCVKQLELELPTIENKPVVNCLFCADSTFKVQISEVTSIVGNSQAPIITDAKCELYSNDTLLEQLTYENGFYYSHTIAQAGKNYTLKVHTSIGDVEATSSVPQSAPEITDIEHKIFSGEYTEWNMAGDQPSTLSFTFKDNQKTKDFYECFIKIQQLFRDSLGDLVTDEYSKPQIELIASNDNFIKSESILEYRPKIIPFTDSLINDENSTLNILYVFQSPESGQLYYNIMWYFRQTSKELYLYRKSLIKHIFTQQPMADDEETEDALFNEIGTVVELYSNVKNGYGIFAGYAEKKDTLTVIYEDFNR